MTTTTEPSKPVRCAGILLHPTSLPGQYGIGDFGPVAHEWVDVLARAGQKWWQVLPLNPTGYGDSPYQSFSAFAGNPNLISPELLRQDGLLRPNDLPPVNFPADHVDYGAVTHFKTGVLTRAWENFQSGSAPGLRQPFEAYCVSESSWLDAHGLFMAIKDAQEGKSWQDWPQGFVLREPAALERARRQLSGGIGRHKFGQFLFARQWNALKKHAHDRNIRLIGDAPIFVSADSADVWANAGLFLLDARRRPTVVAGVPPDYFSATGQLWGNPHYNWEAMKREGYSWWVARMRATLAQVDLVRLDHFRGFEAYWEIPAGMPTAEQGRWVKAPGGDLLATIKKALGGLPIIAEDLGIITPEVEALRDRFGLPGMRILQFAFGGEVENRFLPHNYEHNTVVYTGTHDNDTTVGWWNQLKPHERDFLNRYSPGAGNDIAWNLLRLAWSSVAEYAIAPFQDVLSLGTEARMNFPGKAEGNWQWRFTTGQVNQGVIDRLGDLTALYGRS